jgi:hypothetical protein
MRPTTWPTARPATPSKPWCARHRYRTVRLGRGLPDPALPAGLCRRRHPGHRRDAPVSWDAIRWGRIADGPARRLAAGPCLRQIRHRHRAVGPLRQGLGAAACRAARRAAAETMPLYHSITCVAPEEMAAWRARRRPGITPVSGQARRRQRLAGRHSPAAAGARGGWPRPARLWRLELRRNRLDAIRVGRAVAISTSCWNSPARRWRIAPRSRRATGLPMKLDETGA